MYEILSGSKNKVYLEFRAQGKTKRLHRYIAEVVLGRVLPKKAVVHHFDGNGKNNTNSNLVVCEDDSYHKLLHQREEALRIAGDVHARRCKYCSGWFLPGAVGAVVYVRRGRPKGNGIAVHKACHAERELKRRRLQDGYEERKEKHKKYLREWRRRRKEGRNERE